MKKPKIEVKPADGFEKMGTHLFVNDRALDIPTIGKRYKEMIDVLCDFVWQYEHSNGDVHELDRELGKICLNARETIKTAGVDLNSGGKP